MSEGMNLSINGQSQVPPGFRFHPTEEELLHYYLRKKVNFEQIDLDVIREVDLNKLEPWDIQEKCKIGSTPQNDWYFFSHKDKKYPTGTRTNRATAAGFWKATGRDKIIYSGFRRIGLRKTLVFYKGRAPHGQKSDWIMHEYRLDECTTTNSTTTNDHSTVLNPMLNESGSEEGWVVCRVFKKKNYQKSLESPKTLSMSNNIMDQNNPNSTLLHNHHHHQVFDNPMERNDGVLDQILLYMGRTCKLENDNNHTLLNDIKSNMISSHHLHDLHLPRLESPTTLQSIPNTYGSSFEHHHHHHNHAHNLHGYNSMDTMLLDSSDHQNNNKGDWAAFDRLVASQLNGQDPNTSTTSFCSPSPDVVVVDEDNIVVPLSSYNSYMHSSTSPKQNNIIFDGEVDFWSNFPARSSPSPSSSGPLCHLSV